MNFNIVKDKSIYDEIFGRPTMKQANIIISLRQSYVRHSLNKGEISLKYNQEIHQSNKKEKVRAPNNIVAIVEISNPRGKLEIDDSIEPL